MEHNTNPYNINSQAKFNKSTLVASNIISFRYDAVIQSKQGWEIHYNVLYTNYSTLDPKNEISHHTLITHYFKTWYYLFLLIKIGQVCMKIHDLVPYSSVQIERPRYEIKPYKQVIRNWYIIMRLSQHLKKLHFDDNIGHNKSARYKLFFFWSM